jgi:hypothetical protein
MKATISSVFYTDSAPMGIPTIIGLIISTLPVDANAISSV